MFVPRAVRLKGVKESPKQEPPPAAHNTSNDSEKVLKNGDNTTIEAQVKSDTTSPAPQEKLNHEATARGPKYTTRAITPEYIARLAAGIELIFTDYAHQHEEQSKWLRERYRLVGGDEKFIHLSAVLEHPNISSLKPEATQVLLQQAVREYASSTLELSDNGYYVRRRPSTYPLPFIPADSFSRTDDDGLSFWDQRTIYVEPHARDFCKTPARVAHWLKEHGQMRAKWLPIQAVHGLWNSCAFVVLSGNVMHEDVWRKWRALDKPEWWKVMTKKEHTKRTNEYLELLKEKEKPKPKRKFPQIAQGDSTAKPWAEVGATTESAARSSESANISGKKKCEKKRDHKVNAESELRSAGVNVVGNAVEGDDAQPKKKRGDQMPKKVVFEE